MPKLSGNEAAIGLSYWDAAILAAAKMLGCEAVYSEDMSHEEDYDGLRVINPFSEGVEGDRESSELLRRFPAGDGLQCPEQRRRCCGM